MEKDIFISGFTITYPGDMSVGIFPSVWTIDGPFHFFDEQEYQQFVEKLKEAWEFCSDTPFYIETFEDREELDSKWKELENSGLDEPITGWTFNK